MLRLKDYVPAIRYGAKVMPEDLAGMIGLPYVSRVIYVDPVNGSDSNGGTNANDGYLTVAAAYAAANGNQHEVVLIAPTGSGTGRTTETTAIAWSKKFTHLVGNAAPLMQDLRAGMNFTGTTGTAAGSITFSGTGCIVKNVTFTTTTDNNSFVFVTGDYNSFLNCDFKGALNDTTGDDTAARALVVNGGDENYFSGCTIGSDTYVRSGANASLEVTGNAARTVFEGCLFPVFADAGSPYFVKAASAADIDRFLWFKNCMFHNAIFSSSTTLTVGMTIHAAVGGTVLLDGCAVNGVTDWSSDYTAVRGCNNPKITASNTGFTEQVAT